jgi:hypothetical protein
LLLFVVVLFREEYLTKVERRVKDYQMTLLNPFRENKKLLVLDIDYTLFGMPWQCGLGGVQRKQFEPIHQ